MSELTKVNASEFGLNENQSSEILKGLDQIINERTVLEKQYSEVIQLEITEKNIPLFKSLRLQISKNRTQGINKWHAANKEFYLRGGQFVDAIKRKEIAENERMESNLLENEKYFENLEAQRLKDLQEKRESELSKFVEDASERDLSGMDVDVWAAFIEVKKNEFNTRIEAEKKTETERIEKEKAEAEERLRIKEENDRLKKEAEEAEAKRIVEEAARKKEEEKRQAEAKAQAEKLEAEKRKAQQEFEAKLKAEREEKERIEKQDREKREKLEAEIQAEKDRKELEAKKEAELVEAELSKGDAEKVKDLIKDLETLKTKYSFKSVANIKKYNDTKVLIDKVINHIKK